MDYFEERELSGLEVVMIEPENHRGVRVVSREIWIWQVKSDSNEWIDYKWILMPANPESIHLLETINVPTDYWWIDPDLSMGRKSILLPITESALLVHFELNLLLPKEYNIENLAQIDM
jgi:hypothetical protein